MSENQEKIVKRSDKVAFLNTGTLEAPNFQRMRKFTELSNSKNPREYSREYVDEDGEVTDITGYSPEKSFGFDQYANNPVHEKLTQIIDDELTGDDAVVQILVVDKSKPAIDGGFEARLRNYSVVPDNDGDSHEAYTYSGSFKSKGAFEKKTATISADGKTAIIKEETTQQASEPNNQESAE